MTHLVWFACPGLPREEVRSHYERALASLGDVALVWIALPDEAKLLVREALEHRSPDGRVLPGILRAYPPPHRARPTTVSLVTYAAGCGFARELLRDPDDRAAVDAYVALDSVHAGFDPEGTTADVRLGPLVEYACRAQQRRCLFWLGHSDAAVATHPAAKYARELVRLVGPSAGDWFVRAYRSQTAPPTSAQYGAAPAEWGPGFVNEALVPSLGRG